MEKYTATCRLILVSTSPSKARGGGGGQGDPARRGVEHARVAPRPPPRAPPAGQVIEPVRSRCLGIRVPAPLQSDIISVLNAVAKKEKVSLPLQAAAKIAAASGRNLRRAVLMLEAVKVQSSGEGGAWGRGARGGTGPCLHLAPLPLPPPGTTMIPATIAPPSMDWELYITSLAGDIMREQSPKAAMAARTKFYEARVVRRGWM